MPRALTKLSLLRRVLISLLVFGVFLVSMFGLLQSGASQVNAAGNSSDLNFQARLLTSAGSIVPDGSYSVEFKLYNASTSSGSSQGSCTGDSHCLWVETWNGGNQITVKDGYLSTYLGSLTSFPGTIDWEQPLYLGMNVYNPNTSSWDGEMSPRIQLTALPYAFIASQLATTDGSGNRGTLSFSSVTNNPVVSLPNSTGTLCLDNDTTGCGFAPLTGGTGYIQLQSSTPGTAQTGNFNISGTGIAGTALDAPTIDRASSGTLAIGGTNATTINLGSTGSLAQTVNIATSSGANVITLGSTNSSTTITLKTGATTYAYANGGESLTTSSNSSTAFVIINAGSTDLLQADTTHSSIGIAGASTTAGYNLNVTGTINASGNIYIGGLAVCTSSGCAPSANSTNYIWNTTTLATESNASFSIQAPTGGAVGGTIEGAASGTADLLDLIDDFSGASTVDKFGYNGANQFTGTLTLGNSSSAAGTLAFDDASNTNTVSITAGTTSASYSLTLPTKAPAAGLCLETDTATSSQLIFASCANSNASITYVNSWDSSASISSSSYTLSDSPVNVGDLLVVTADIPTAGPTVSSISGGGVTSWTTGKVVTSAGNGAYYRVEMWMGTVSTTGAGTVTVNYSTSISGTVEVTATEFTAAGVNANTTWGVDTSGSSPTASTSTTITYPSLVSEGSAELYFGYGQAQNITGNDPSAGSTAGFSYIVPEPSTAGSGVIAYATPTSSNTTYHPTASQSMSEESNTVGAIFTAFLSSTAINNSTSQQQGNFYVQAATAGSTAGILEANGTTGYILELRSSGGTSSASDVFNVGATGAALFQNSVNSYNAFQINDGNGTPNSILTADTNDDRIVIGNYGTGSTSADSTSQLFVGGSIPTSSVGSVSTGASSGPAGVYVQGRYAYVVDGSTNKLAIYDVSNPASPTSVGSVSTGASTSPTSVYVQGRYAYVVLNGTNTLAIYDVSNPASPSSVSSISTGGSSSPYSVYVQGRYAYVADDGTNVLAIYDVSNPASPTLAGSLATGASSGPRNVYVQGRYAYVGEATSGLLAIYDVSNPNTTCASSCSVSTVSTGSGLPTSVYVQGRYAYVTTTTNGLVIFDVSNPASPTSVATVSTACAFSFAVSCSVYVQGRYAYVVGEGYNYVDVYDISTPATPTLVGSIATGSGSNPVGLYVQGRYVYVVDISTNSLAVYDLGGAYIQQLQTGGIETGTLQTEGDATINGDMAISGGLTVSQGVELNGNVGIGGALSIYGAVTVQTLVNSATAFEIENATPAPVFTVDTTHNSVLISAATTSTTKCGTVTGNGVCLSANGIVLSGNARASEEIILNPQYAGGAIDTTGCSGNTSGTWTTGIDKTGSGGFKYVNYYKWASSGTSQCQDIVINVPIPQDFSATGGTTGWASTTPMTILVNTSSTTNGTAKVLVYDSAGTQLGSTTTITPGSANTWTAETPTAANLPFATSGTWTAGGYFTIDVRLTGSASATVEVGEITLSYLRGY